MMADFEGLNIDGRFLQLLRKASPIRWGLFHHQQTSTYFRDHVVLMGDSAHASLPFQAGGAAQGVEDALFLSELLSSLARGAEERPTRDPYIRAALEAYDSIRRPRAQRQVERAAEVADMLYFQHAETGSDVNKILAKLQSGWFEWLWFPDFHSDLQRALTSMDSSSRHKAVCK